MGKRMGDFTNSADDNVRLMKEKLRVDTNFDISIDVEGFSLNGI